MAEQRTGVWQDYLHKRPDGTPCNYGAISFCDKCGWSEPMVSDCCRAALTVSAAGEGTCCYMCGSCERPCAGRPERAAGPSAARPSPPQLPGDGNNPGAGAGHGPVPAPGSAVHPVHLKQPDGIAAAAGRLPLVTYPDPFCRCGERKSEHQGDRGACTFMSPERACTCPKFRAAAVTELATGDAR